MNNKLLIWIFLLIMLVSSAAATNLSSSIYGHFSFDQGTYYTSGVDDYFYSLPSMNYDGHIPNAYALLGNVGFFDQGIKFREDLGFEYASISTNNQVWESNNFTVNLWIKPEKNTDYESIFTGTSLRLSKASNNTLYWRYYADSCSSYTPIYYDDSWNDNEWLMITVVGNNKNISIYMDGEYFTSSSYTNDTLCLNSNAVVLGMGGFPDNYAGYIDELTFFNNSLSDLDVSRIYFSGAGTIYPFTDIYNFSVNTNILDYNITLVSDETLFFDSTTFSTTTNLSYDDARLWNVTLQSETYDDLVFTNYNISTNINAVFLGTPIILLRDYLEKNRVSSFIAEINGVNYSTTQSYLEVPLLGVYNVTFHSIDYFSSTQEFNFSNSVVYNATIYQSIIDFDAYEIFTDVNLSDVSFYSAVKLDSVDEVIYVGDLDISPQDSSPQDLSFNDDGTKLFVLGSGSEKIYEYSLIIPYDRSTASYVDYLDISNMPAGMKGMSFNSDGSSIYILYVGATYRYYKYDFTTPYDMSTGSYTSYTSASFNFGNSDIDFEEEGTKLFLSDYFDDSIKEYSLSIPYDVSTMTLLNTLELPLFNPQGFSFNEDGTKIYIAGETIKEYELPRPFDLYTYLYLGEYNSDSEDSLITGVTVSSEGDKIFLSGSAGDSIYEYTNFELINITSGTYFNEGLHNILAVKEGYYNLTQEINITALDEKTINLTEMYNLILNITAQNYFTNTSIYNFAIDLIYGSNNYVGDTTNGSIFMNALSNLTYNITSIADDPLYTVNDEEYVIADNPNIIINFYYTEALYIQVNDAINSSLIDFETINFELSGQESRNTSTTDGTYIFTNLSVGDYNLAFVAEGYLPNTYSFSVIEDTYSEVILNLTQPTYSSINAYNLFNNDSINNFSAEIDEIIYSTTNGNLTFPIIYDVNYNVTLFSTNYINKTVEISFNATYVHNISLYQSIINFDTYEIFTEDELNNLTYYINDTEVTTSYLNVGSYNVTVVKDNYYNITQEFSVTALDIKTINVTDMYDALINITAQNHITNVSISNFTVNMSYNNWTANELTTNGVLLIPAKAGYNYTLNTSSQEHLSFVNEYVIGVNQTDILVSLYQSIIDFDTYEIFTEYELSNITYYINDSEVTTSYLNVGSYNVTAVKDNYYNITQEFSVTALDIKTINVTDMYDALLNITAQEYIANTSISNFTASLTYGNWNTDGTTTDGILLIPVKAGYTYSMVATTENDTYATHTETYIIGINQTDILIDFYFGESIYITWNDETSLELLDSVTIEFEMIGPSFGNFSTTDGTYTAINLDVGNYILRYNAEGYDERFYYFTIVEDNYNIITLYLLNSTTADDVIITVVNENYDVVDSATVKALRYESTTGNYELRDQCRTGNSGTCQLRLTYNDEFYKFQVEYESQTELTTSPEYVISTSIILQIYLGESIGQDYFEWDNIDVSLIYNNATTNFRLTYNDVDGVATNFCLYVYKLRHGKETLIDSGCNLLPSGTILVSPGTLQNNTIYIARAYYENNFLISATHETPPNNDLGNFGMLLQIMLTIVFIAIAIYEISLIPLSISVSLVLGRILHLNILPWTNIWIIIVVSVILTWFIKRYR